MDTVFMGFYAELNEFISFGFQINLVRILNMTAVPFKVK